MPSVAGETPSDLVRRIQRSPGRHRPILRSRRRLDCVDPDEEERRPDVRGAVDDQRVRAAEELHEYAAEAGAGEEGEAAAAVEERVGLNVVLASHERLEEAAVGDLEEDARRPEEERDHVELGPGE